jgi:hypothetical protein
MKNMLRQAEECRRKAGEVRRIADSCRSRHESEAFRRLARGYDVLARQLEQVPCCRDEGDDIAWLIRDGSNRDGRPSRNH